MNSRRIMLAALVFGMSVPSAHAQKAPSPIGPGGTPVPIDQGVTWTPAMWIAAFKSFVSTSGGTASDITLNRPLVSASTPWIDFRDENVSNADTGRIRVQNVGGNLTIGAVSDNGSIFTPWLVCSRQASSPTDCSFAVGYSAPDGEHNGPLVGDRLGLAQSAYNAPNPHFIGTATVTGPQPGYILNGIATNARAAFYMDWDKNATIQTYANGARLNLITNGGAVQIQNVAPNGDSALWFVPQSGVLTPITVDWTGHMTLGNNSTPMLSIAVKNFQVSALPVTNPGSGAHFACVDDAGDFYRSDSECR